MARRNDRSGPRRFKPDTTATPRRITLQIERLSDEGRGIGHFDGQTVFVRGALPGEQVTAEVQHRRRGVWEAQALSIAEASALRRTPPCSLVADCGGCTLQHLDTDAQLQHKTRVLHQTLAAIDSDIEWLPPLTSPAYGYRHRARMKLAKVNRRWILGYRHAGSHQVCQVSECAVLMPGLQTVLASLQRALPELPGSLPATVLLDQDSQGRVGLLLRYEQSPEEPVLSAWQRIAAEIHVALWLLVRDQVVIAPQRALTWEPIPGLPIHYSPADFTQANPWVNHAIVSAVMQLLHLTRDDTVIDAFAGLGNFSLPAADSGAQVIALENDPTLVARTRRAASDLGIATLRAEVCDLFTTVPAWGDANTLIVDPPRAGAQALCEAVGKSPIQQIAYISCHPATLIRDLKILKASGFGLRQSFAADMFPQTGHLEGVVLLQR